MPNSKLLTKQEAADYLRVSTKTIDEYRKNKKLIGCKIGRKWLIRESELERSLKTKTENLLTKKEVSEKLKVSDDTVDNWVKQGILTPLSAGGVARLVRFNSDEVEAVFKKRNAKSVKLFTDPS